MENRIELAKRGKNPSQIKELVLDNCCSTTIVGLTDEFKNLESLSLINVGLTSLKGLPKLLKLQKLDLSDNRISGGLNILSNNCPKLTSLNLSGNRIADIEALEPLKELKGLKTLDLFSCEVTSTEKFKEKISELLPGLKSLDCSHKDDEDSEDENGEKLDGTDSENEDEDLDGEDDEDEDDSEDEDEEGEVGLSYLEKENIDEESEGDDYSPDDEVDGDEDLDDDDEEEEEEDNPRGQKRKLENNED